MLVRHGGDLYIDTERHPFLGVDDALSLFHYRLRMVGF